MKRISELTNEIKAEMNDVSVDLVTDYAGCSMYICDAIAEHADGCTSIYNADIKNFMMDNFDAVENAISEFGWDGCGADLYKAGQMAEYLENERLMYEDEENIIKLAALDFLGATWEEISADAWEELQADLSAIDSGDRFDVVDDVVRDFIGAGYQHYIKTANKAHTESLLADFADRFVVVLRSGMAALVKNDVEAVYIETGAEV